MPPPRPAKSSDHELNRVHEELEKLNIATDVINKLELQLDEARTAFREIQTTWTQKLDVLLRKHKSCIEKARPYYEARLKARAIQQEAQKAALRFERANSMHAIAKEQVALTQESLALQQGSLTIEPVCLEVLNHHVGRVNDAERERLLSKEEHQRIKHEYEAVLLEVSALEKDGRRSIAKSRPYFEARVDFTKVLENQKALISRLEQEIKQKKRDYSASLKRLEQISNEIHEMRMLGERQSGVGAEKPDPPVSDFEADRLAAAARTKSISPPAYDDNVLLTPITPGDRDHHQGSRDRASTVPNPRRDSASIASGIILLAHHLDDVSFLNELKAKAFSLPAEDYDCHYRTLPAGVKPFPTPPHTPTDGQRSTDFGNGQTRRGSTSVPGGSPARRGSVQKPSPLRHANLVRRSSSGGQIAGTPQPPPLATSPPPLLNPGALGHGASASLLTSSGQDNSGSDSETASLKSGHSSMADDDKIEAYLTSDAYHAELMEQIGEENHEHPSDSEERLDLDVPIRGNSIATVIKKKLEALRSAPISEGRCAENLDDGQNLERSATRSSGSGEEEVAV